MGVCLPYKQTPLTAKLLSYWEVGLQALSDRGKKINVSKWAKGSVLYQFYFSHLTLPTLNAYDAIISSVFF